MAVRYFPFNSAIIDGKPDRAANAETLAMYLKTFFTDGVVMHSSTALQVDAKEGLTVQIRPGRAFLDGRVLDSTAVEELTLDESSYLLNRIDRIIFRLDYGNRLMKFMVLKGEEGSEPMAPELQRDADIYDMCLAEVYVGAATTTLSQSNITDTRANSEVCGIAAAAITQLDTATLYRQFTAQFTEAFDELNAWSDEQKATIESMIADLQAQGFENAAVYTETTMAAASWNAAAKTYSFEALYPSGTYDIWVQPVKPCTAEQLEAWGGAMLLADAGTNVLTALGDVPAVDIPVIIRAVKK